MDGGCCSACGGWVVVRCQPIKVTKFAFDKNAVLWPEITCLDGCVEGFSKNIALSAPN